MATVRERVSTRGVTSYAVLFRHPPGRDGRQKSKTFGDRKSADAFAQLVDLLGPDRALVEVEASTGITLDELAEKFFAWKATRVRSDRTVADYRRDYENWIQPYIGHRAASMITEADVQDLVQRMEERLQPKSVADRHAILHGIYKFGAAPSRRLVEHNPCIGTDLPKRKKKSPKGLRPAEWQALAIALRQIDDDAADLADYLLASGWRFSEAVALSPFDVEDYGDAMFVTMGRVLRRNAAGQAVIVEDEGKSEAAMRRTQLDEATAEMVRRRIAERNRLGLVFTTNGGSQWNYSHFRSRYWVKAVAAANLTRKPTPHWLRHTHVAWMLIAGASLAEVQKRIGHESITTTVNVYGGMVADVSSSAVLSFAAMRDENVAARSIEG